MIINQDITDSIGHSSFCLVHLKELKDDVGNPKNINPETHWKNIQTMRGAILYSFNQYQGTRKIYSHTIIELQEILDELDKDFLNIISISGLPTKEQITQLEGIIFKIQKLIVEKIKDDPTYYMHLKENFPNNFP